MDSQFGIAPGGGYGPEEPENPSHDPNGFNDVEEVWDDPELDYASIIGDKMGFGPKLLEDGTGSKLKFVSEYITRDMGVKDPDKLVEAILYLANSTRSGAQDKHNLLEEICKMVANNRKIQSVIDRNKKAQSLHGPSSL